ncbi:hypothetical protein RYX36_013859 [Vicia faba]
MDEVTSTEKKGTIKETERVTLQRTCSKNIESQGVREQKRNRNRKSQLLSKGRFRKWKRLAKVVENPKKKRGKKVQKCTTFPELELSNPISFTQIPPPGPNKNKSIESVIQTGGTNMWSGNDVGNGKHAPDPLQSKGDGSSEPQLFSYHFLPKTKMKFIAQPQIASGDCLKM